MPNLVSDKPISSEDDDVLGLTSFADALAKSLVEMAPDEDCDFHPRRLGLRKNERDSV